MPTTTTPEEEALVDFQKALAELETAVTTKVTRTLSQRFGPTGRFGPAGGSSEAIGSAHQRAVLVADEAPVRAWLSQPRSFRSSIAFEGRIERRAATPVTNVSPSLYVPGIHGPAQPSLRLDSLLPRVSILGGGSVEWTKEILFDATGAGIAPEASLKPSTTLSFANVTTPFVTVAVFTKASVQSLADVPSLMDWIGQRLLYSVSLRSETYFLTDPVAGLLPAAQPLDPAYVPPAPATQLDAIGAAISQLSAAGYQADGVVLAGTDSSAMRLLKTSQGQYIWASPDSSVGVSGVWATPAIISPSMPSGEFLVGAFSQAALLFTRDSLRLDISFENEDDFVRNLATIRAEARLALAIPAPSGLIKGSFTAGATTAKSPAPPASK